MSRTTAEPLARLARDQYLGGHEMMARISLMRLIGEVIGAGVAQVSINRDAYSLNSLNGTVTLADGSRFFFKFHAEEGEEDTITEYYNAELLDEAGYPVDVPVYACGEPGRQILLYRLRPDPRFSDVCRALEHNPSSATVSQSEAVAAQRELDATTSARMHATLHTASTAELAAEPINRLFRDRLVNAGGDPPAQGEAAGRVAAFYRGKTHALGAPDRAVELSWQQFRDALWVVNGVEYAHSVGELFAEAVELLAAPALGPAAVVAHGDAHNANVWFERGGAGEAHLVQFDPAFAGRNVPALLAEVKATFHNVFAHPFWLYEPGQATERFTADAQYRDGRLHVTHSWQPSPLRREFLAAKADEVWRPLLAELAARGELPARWRRILRLALFCCPTLVHELRAGGPTGHTPVTAAIGWAVAIGAGSEPLGGGDLFAELIDSIAPPRPPEKRNAT